MIKRAIRLMPVQLVSPSHEQTPINTLFERGILIEGYLWKRKWLYKSILIISLGLSQMSWFWTAVSSELMGYFLNFFSV